jgi:hypothetical protein
VWIKMWYIIRSFVNVTVYPPNTTIKKSDSVHI